MQLVRLEVTDLAGNTSFCETFIDIQDNTGACTTTSTRITGAVKDEMGQGIKDVNIDLNNSGSILSNLATDIDGQFTFNNLPVGNDYTITPSFDGDITNGVSTFDLVVMSKHILNVDLLDSPYRLIAADANRSGTITTLDLVAVRKVILRVANEFPSNSSWRFIDGNYIFPDASDPFSIPFPEVMNYNNLNVATDFSDFVAVKIGDVNNDARPSNLLGVDDRTFNGTLSFAVEDQTFNAEQTIAVPFTADDFSSVLGYQFTLNFDTDALQLVDVQTGNLEGLTDANFGMTMVNDGILTTSWDNSKTTLNGKTDVLFTLHFQTKTAGTLSKSMNISSQFTAAEAYAALNDNDVENRDVTLRFDQNVVDSDFVLYQNTPNPFAQSTTIGFTLPNAGAVTLSIYDVSSKILKVVNGDFEKGYNTIEVSNTDIAAKGVLYYRLETGAHTATRKMIIVR